MTRQLRAELHLMLPLSRSRPSATRRWSASPDGRPRRSSLGGSGHRVGALVVVVAALAVCLPGVAASEETSTTTDPESALAVTRGDLDQVTGELALLRHSDEELADRLEVLEVDIAAATAEVAAADAAMADAAAQVAAVEARVVVARDRVADQQVLVDARAVSAYVDAGSAGMSTLLATTEPNRYAERVLLLQRVNENDQEILDRLVTLQEDLRAEEAEAERVRAEATRLAGVAAEALAALEASRAEEVAVQEALELRIAAFESEADQLAATEAELVALIAVRASQPEEPPPPPPTSPPTTEPPTTEPPTVTTTTAPGPRPTTPTTAPPVTTTVPPTTSPPPPPGGPSFGWPAAGPVTSPFGERWGRMHEGIDIGGWTGDPISAAAGGRVILAGVLGGYGNCVMIDHGSGYVTVYAHQSAMQVTEGETVSAGQTIGRVGNTGNSTGPHLHFEVRIGGTPYDPMRFLP